MFCIFTEVWLKIIKLFLNKTSSLIFSFYLCLSLTSPNYAFMRCRLYSIISKTYVISNIIIYINL